MFEKPGKNKQDKETTTIFRKYIASFFVLNPFPSGVFWGKGVKIVLTWQTQANQN